MSLKDGKNKMSKSDPSDLSRINLTDDKDQIVNKIKKAKTDNDPLPSDDKNLSNRPEVENLLGIYSSLTGQSLKNSINEFSGKNFSEFKKKLAEIVVEKISPISIEINKLQRDINYIDKILKEGGKRADLIASKKVREMKKIIGF
jgi:Tryptophanyl-tRNA synthetase